VWRRHSCPRTSFGLFETKNVTLKESAMFRPKLAISWHIGFIWLAVLATFWRRLLNNANYNSG